MNTRPHPFASLSVIFTVVAVAGCSGEEKTAQRPAAPMASSPAAESTPTSTPGSKPTEPAEQAPEGESKPDSTDARDKRRAKQFLTDYGADGRSRWLIKSVSVEDGAVTVKTELSPEASNEPKFTGACSSLMDWEDWMTSLEILGTDGAPHATWSDGDAFCDVDV